MRRAAGWNGRYWLGPHWLGRYWLGRYWLGRYWLGQQWLGRYWLGVCWLGAWAFACSPPNPKAVSAANPPASETAPRSPELPPPVAAVDLSSASTAAPPTTGPAPARGSTDGTAGRPTLPEFQPPPFAPPFQASKATEDGSWRLYGDSTLGEVAAQAPPVLYRSTVHPHPTSPFVSMDVVALDLRQLELHWVIGKKDQGQERLASFGTAGLLPEALQERALAVFNGGFQARHGYWGMGSHGVAVLAPKPQGCTLLVTPDGQVGLGPWEKMSWTPEQLLFFRQGPPCLLHEGKIHPNLESGLTRVWAGENPELKTRRRSAVGIDASGQTLFFAIGTETRALDLARGMQAIGAVTALQLDINWAWTRFLLAGRREGLPRVTSSLVEGSLHGKNEYFGRASDRDFFAVIRRAR